MGGRGGKEGVKALERAGQEKPRARGRAASLSGVCTALCGRGATACSAGPRPGALFPKVVRAPPTKTIYDSGHSMFPFNRILNLKTANYCLCKHSIKV